MAIGKKGSRQIEVDGVRYRWNLRRKPTYDQGNAWNGLGVAVELEEGGRVLLIRGADTHPGNWMAAPASPITPARVEAWIREGLKRGWDAHAPGGPFEIVGDFARAE